MLIDRKPQTVVPVMGMHRSGTSMLTHMLSVLGVELGWPLQPPSFDNPKGFWENRIFQVINMDLLKNAGCNTDGFDEDLKLRETCHRLEEAEFPESLYETILKYTKNTFQNTHWGWKDPRTVITWPFWKRCLKALGYTDIRPVVLVRHPASSVSSLKKRGDFSNLMLPQDTGQEEFFLSLWKTYYELVGSYFSDDALILLQEDLLDSEKAEKEIERCVDYLGLTCAGIGPAMATVDTGLISHKKQDQIEISNQGVRRVYESLANRSNQQQEAYYKKLCSESIVITNRAEKVHGRFCIYIATPENYIHSHSFDEHALSLHYAFNNLGYVAPIVRYPWGISGTPVVLGANLLPHARDINIPPESILYNLEQIQEGSPWLKPEYIDLLSRFQVWDYSPQNIAALEKYNVRNVRLCRVGYVPQLDYISDLPEYEEDIDVLFYGTLNERRRAVIMQLKEEGLRVESTFGVYGLRRDRLISRSKIVINIHYYESKVMEIIRLSFLLANKRFIVSENGNDKSVELSFEGGIVFVDYGSIVETCCRYINSVTERGEIADRGHEIFSAHNQEGFLKEALQ
ncbi:MAG: hypothetical protein ACE5GV_01820 [Candidatus Scalindua sp.]